MAVKVLEGKHFIPFIIPDDTVKSVNRRFTCPLWQESAPINVRGRNS